MPKITVPPLPVSCLLGMIKPSGPTSMSLLNDLQPLLSKSRLFEQPPLDAPKRKKKRSKKVGDVKVGQGGTLDPLADGILVLGVGKGTKKLTEFLDCTKEYSTTCLLGCETDSYDSEGGRVRLAPWKHVTKEQVVEALNQFRGEIKQTPPIFSALKMDGKPLYEYARNGIPLPRPIEPRTVTVHSLELVEWKGSDHSFSWPEKALNEGQKKAMEAAIRGVDKTATIEDDPESTVQDEVKPTAFVIKMKVSGGTYVRSLVHDLAHALGSAGHVVTLTRSRQGRFVLNSTEDGDRTCVPWSVFEKALTDPGAADEDGWTEWEREILQHMEVI
ncbi:pseudouridine synthase [Lentinula lateritia]|uniref:Pseudouridine synthase n=1 Tax=Lentinula aff. lateritia TaxID=2804960 RepID=A0ACC1TWH7_9AGAR|nr:pseudouridine synthase [Lentinula aff. lateritia]KAJ3851345.1 pseudouridine synthase [Lentinula lateritia]